MWVGEFDSTNQFGSPEETSSVQLQERLRRGTPLSRPENSWRDSPCSSDHCGTDKDRLEAEQVRLKEGSVRRTQEQGTL